MSINNKRSYTEYTVTQPTTDFAIGFDDFDEGGKDNILVTLNGVLVESLGYAALRKNESTVTITPAITEGTVRLTRETDIDEPFHKFTAGALFSAKSMDENFQQVRNSQQEVRDGFVFLEYNTNGIVQASKEATAQAKAATVEATASAVRAESAADTAVQAVGSLQGVVNAATTATTNANIATASATTAASQATAATTSAQNAAQAANTAKQEAAAAAANANAATVGTLAATGRANEAADVVEGLTTTINNRVSAVEVSQEATIQRVDNFIATDVIPIVNDAINNTAVEGGVLADTFVVATANGIGSVARTQADKNSDVISIKDFPDIVTAQATADMLNSKIFIPAGEHSYDATNYNPDLFYGDGVVVDTVSGKRYKPNHKWYVTPEMFGAVGDGVADDSDALIAADLYAKDNELALIGTGKYLITKTWSIKTHSVDISKKGIVIAPNFEHEAAVIGNGNFRPYPSYHTITFFGNKESQTHGVIAYLVNDQASNGLYVKLSAQECNTVLYVGSAVERSEFDVWAARCDSVVEEIPRDRPGDVTADEVKYYISGGSCGRWYYKDAVAACVVEFNVEQTLADSEHVYAVEIANTGNKGVVLKGIIRVTEGKAILGAGTATLIFNELLVVGAKGTVLTLDTGGAVYGSLTAQYSESDVLDFKKLSRGGHLIANIDSFKTKGITLGVADGSSRVAGLVLRATVFQGSVTVDNTLESYAVIDSHIDINANGQNPKGVYIHSSAASSNRYTFNSRFLVNNVPFTYNTKSIYDIEFVGSVVTSAIRNFSTPLSGMRASSRDHSGTTLLCKGSVWYEPSLSLISGSPPSGG